MLANSLKHSIRITTQPFSKRFLSPTSFCLQRIIEVVPPLGESITEGSVAQWAKEEGSRIEVDDVIVIVETDKVTVDVKSTRAGVLLKRLATDTVSCFKKQICILLISHISKFCFVGHCRKAAI